MQSVGIHLLQGRFHSSDAVAQNHYIYGSPSVVKSWGRLEQQMKRPRVHSNMLRATDTL